MKRVATKIDWVIRHLNAVVHAFVKFAMFHAMLEPKQVLIKYRFIHELSNLLSDETLRAELRNSLHNSSDLKDLAVAIDGAVAATSAEKSRMFVFQDVPIEKQSKLFRTWLTGPIHNLMLSNPEALNNLFGHC